MSACDRANEGVGSGSKTAVLYIVRRQLCSIYSVSEPIAGSEYLTREDAFETSPFLKLVCLSVNMSR